MSSEVTKADIRRTSGIDSDMIDDTDVDNLVTEAEYAVERYLNTSIGEKTRTEFRQAPYGGTDSPVLLLRKTPILNILAIRIGGTSISPKHVKRHDPSGKLILTRDADETTWNSNEEQNNTIRYVYGVLEETSTSTSLSSAVSDGDESDSFSLSVSDTTDFSSDDMIKVEGLDGYREVTKVISTGSGTITADITYPHEEGSKITKLQVPFLVKRLVEVITTEMMVARIVGASYDKIVGYGLGDMNVQKGEPYTQWKETYREIDHERERILKRLRQHPHVG